MLEENVDDLSNPKIKEINKKIHDLIISLIKDKENEIQNIMYALNYEYFIFLHAIAKKWDEEEMHSFNDVISHFMSHLIIRFAEYTERQQQEK